MGAVCCMNGSGGVDNLVQQHNSSLDDVEHEEFTPFDETSPEAVRLNMILQEISWKRSVTPSFLESVYKDHKPTVHKQAHVPIKSNALAAHLENTCSWKIVHGQTHPVFDSKTSELTNMVGMKEVGDLVQAHLDGEWLVLSDKKGFMRLMTTDGISVAERLDETSTDLELESTGTRDQTSIQSSVDIGSLGPNSNTSNDHTPEASVNNDPEDPVVSGSSDICSWVVAYKTRFPIHSDMTKQTGFLGTKKPGEVFRGRRVGDWVALVDEPGYIRLIGVNTHSVVLEKVDNDSANRQ